MIVQTPIGEMGLCILDNGRRILAPIVHDCSYFEQRPDHKVGKTLYDVNAPEHRYSKLNENMIWYKNRETGERLCIVR